LTHTVNEQFCVEAHFVTKYDTTRSPTSPLRLLYLSITLQRQNYWYR
jgi:hypothetical protein